MTEVPCPRECRLQKACRRVSRAGVLYRCAAALANEMGVTRHAVYQSFYRHGDAESVGKPTKGGNNRRPVKIGKHSWPSISHLARDLGMGRSHIDKLVRHQPERLLGIVMRMKG